MKKILYFLVTLVFLTCLPPAHVTAQDPLRQGNIVSQYLDNNFKDDSISESLDHFGLGLVMLSIGAFIMAASLHFLFEFKEDLKDEILSLEKEVEKIEVIRRANYETVPSSVEVISNIDDQLEAHVSNTPYEEAFDYLLKEVS